MHLTNKEISCDPNKTCLQIPKLPVYSKTLLSENPSVFILARAVGFSCRLKGLHNYDWAH